ncbi:hypothetical protein [Candidatus Frankia alpina]|uniref:hypothetical protein n=1 Tax=Candidatus Frankia alpina TaxID=2699483 RepID=UPI001F45E72B|nr:hypothetical protein [Candidatus Frankia alpina]
MVAAPPAGRRSSRPAVDRRGRPPGHQPRHGRQDEQPTGPRQQTVAEFGVPADQLVRGHPVLQPFPGVSGQRHAHQRDQGNYRGEHAEPAPGGRPEGGQHHQQRREWHEHDDDIHEQRMRR